MTYYKMNIKNKSEKKKKEDKDEKNVELTGAYHSHLRSFVVIPFFIAIKREERKKFHYFN
jgi:hypothetical protein